MFQVANWLGKAENVAEATMSMDGNSLVNDMIPFSNKQEAAEYEELYKRLDASLRAQVNEAKDDID